MVSIGRKSAEQFADAVRYGEPIAVTGTGGLWLTHVPATEDGEPARVTVNMDGLIVTLYDPKVYCQSPLASTPRLRIYDREHNYGVGVRIRGSN